MKLVHIETQKAIAGRVLIADTPRKRAFGLLALPPLKDNDVLWIEPCSGIHTFGMKYALDVVLLDKHGTILALRETVSAWRFVWFQRGARVTLEARTGFIERHGLRVGHRLHRQDE